MNIETLELIAVAETTETAKEQELFALSIDDLDLVGGGCTLGSLS
jgi:hypothetical protein